jgi:hypothetical protein
MDLALLAYTKNAGKSRALGKLLGLSTLRKGKTLPWKAL